MKAPPIMDELKSLGIVASVQGESLRLKPASKVDPVLQEQIRSSKAEIISYLSQREAVLSWASRLSEQDLSLDVPVSFVEAPLRTISTRNISRYAANYLRVVLAARSERQFNFPTLFDRNWWTEREEEALDALASLKAALEGVAQ